MINKAFLGRGWSFPPEFNRTSGEVTLVSEDEDIQESLSILLTTAPGERVMNPAYGCGLKLLTFENISESTVTEIKDVIGRAILVLSFYRLRTSGFNPLMVSLSNHESVRQQSWYSFK